jgi:predicted TIM-barrel fold metal-dependent hydrolase
MPFQNFNLFDAHFHIIDNRFPLVPNNGYVPEPFTCEGYLKRMARYRLAGGAVVSGSFQAFDQTYLVDALKTLGPSFVGVTQVPATISDARAEGQVLKNHFSFPPCSQLVDAVRHEPHLQDTSQERDTDALSGFQPF